MVLAIFLILLIYGQDNMSDTVSSPKASHKILSVKKSTLNIDKPELFISGFSFVPGESYRVILSATTVQSATLSVAVAYSANSHIQEIGSVSFDAVSKYLSKEFLFTANEKYNGFLLRENGDVHAEFFLRDIRVTSFGKMKPRSLQNLQPTMLGFRSPESALVASQTVSDTSFLQLSERNTTIGQVFRANSGNVSSVVLNVDSEKQSESDDIEYILELRRVEKEDDMFLVQKNPVATLRFSLSDLGRYRQADGEIRFPLLAGIVEGEYYFIGISNKKQNDRDLGDLILRGSSETQYFDGPVIILQGDRRYEVSGNLFFQVYGFQLTQNGKNGVGEVLLGTTIEDMGRGNGQYVYKSLDSIEELLDLRSASGDVSFSADENVVFGKSDESGSYFEYRFDMLYPAQRISFSAQQARSNWSPVLIQYSFDEVNWLSIDARDVSGLQYFEETIDFASPNQRVLFLRVSPLKTEEGYYGIRDLMFSADLNLL